MFVFFFSQGFFTYLYGVSILFLLYVFCYLLTNGSKSKRTRKVASGSKLKVNLFQMSGDWLGEVSKQYQAKSVGYFFMPRVHRGNGTLYGHVSELSGQTGTYNVSDYAKEGEGSAGAAEHGKPQLWELGPVLSTAVPRSVSLPLLERLEDDILLSSAVRT
ncbi:unnamed protein product [Cyprideis torosa]|uniref:Uncharacterized protein n=1 Tax=Cyprideis torosa TaxID=163714 RepID=A0A7R8WE19_9CRUS|nr:unnamed protein product [Cyprideis torosa]CAG0889208.1 unnamed protein product [Cyprideis torosa]